MSRQFTYGKDEKLKSRKIIESLFNSGQSFTVYPLKVLYKIESSDEAILQAGVAVSKRLFKKAVERNWVKRLMRESYRIQKNDLKEIVRSRQVAVYLFFI
jgi:ribonuclease P protein component